MTKKTIRKYAKDTCISNNLNFYYFWALTNDKMEKSFFLQKAKINDVFAISVFYFYFIMKERPWLSMFKKNTHYFSLNIHSQMQKQTKVQVAKPETSIYDVSLFISADYKPSQTP